MGEAVDAAPSLRARRGREEPLGLISCWRREHDLRHVPADGVQEPRARSGHARRSLRRTNTATIVFDDAKTTVAALIASTTNARCGSLALLMGQKNPANSTTKERRQGQDGEFKPVSEISGGP